MSTASGRDAARGRRVVVVVGAVLLLNSAIDIALYVLNVGIDNLPQQLVRFIVLLVLVRGLDRGSSAARWIAVVLFTLGGVLSSVQALADDEMWLWPSWLAIAAFGGAALLTFQRDVGAYFRTWRP
ncbi:MAG: hypothetical protein AAF219_07205 [Myxococcota bacterium]